MMIAGLTVGELTQISTLLGVIFVIAKGIVTQKEFKRYKAESKKDCIKCKTDTDKNLEDGSDEFKEIRSILTDQGEQISGIGATVTAMSGNVDLLVSHHIGGNG